MGQWRYYVQRAKSGAWLDTNAEFSDVSMTWALSGPMSGKATVSSALNRTPFAADGQLTWGKWNTILWAEEDGKLAWMGICVDATPAAGGKLSLELVGPVGWLKKIPYDSTFTQWEPNAFAVIRRLINHSATYSPRIDFVLPTTLSAYYLGDTKPPPKPVKPKRRRGQTVANYNASAAVKSYNTKMEAWNKAYSSLNPYSINWWDSTLVGEEIDKIAKDVGIDYRERVEWVNRANLETRIHLDLSDHMSNRRTDLAFVDGHNIVNPLDPKEGTDDYAAWVIGLGSGDGKAKKRTLVGADNGRLYQAEFVSYSNVSSLTTLKNLAKADHKIMSNLSPLINAVRVRDIPGFASLATLRCGDEVNLKSTITVPPVDQWVRVNKITRDPSLSYVDLELEQAA